MITNIDLRDVELPFEGITEEYVAAQLQGLIEALELNNMELSLLLTNNKQIKLINNEYRKKNYATDVISFAYRDGDEPFPLAEGEIEYLGDIIISLDMVKSQAVEYEVSDCEEFTRLLVHGMLHLLGYDHEQDEEKAKVMEAKEDELLSRLLD